MGPTAWAVLEDVALDASLDDAGRLVSTTSSRRIADNLGMTAGTAARSLGRLRALGLVSYTRHDGAAGRFGLSAYVLGPVPGLDVVDPADTPAIAGPRPVPPRPASPHVDRPRAVDAHMVGAPAADACAAESARRSRHDDVVGAVAGPLDDLAAEERARSTGTRPAARRRRQPASAQLSILDGTDQPELNNQARHR